MILDGILLIGIICATVFACYSNGQPTLSAAAA